MPSYKIPKKQMKDAQKGVKDAIKTSQVMVTEAKKTAIPAARDVYAEPTPQKPGPPPTLNKDLMKSTEDAASVWKPQYETEPTYKAQYETRAGWQDTVGPNETANTDAIGRRYSALQQTLRSRESAQAQGEQAALNRRFAAMGALNSGAAIRSGRVQSDMSARREEDARNQLFAAQSGEEQGAWENAAQRNLGREGMRLQSQESMFGRNLQRSGMEMQSKEGMAGRNLTREGLGLQQSQGAAQRGLTRESWAFQGGQNDIDRTFQNKQLEQQANQFQQQMNVTMQELALKNKEFALNEEVTRNNMAMAEKMYQQNKGSWLEQILPWFSGISMDKPIGSQKKVGLPPLTEWGKGWSMEGTFG